MHGRLGRFNAALACAVLLCALPTAGLRADGNGARDVAVPPADLYQVLDAEIRKDLEAEVAALDFPRWFTPGVYRLHARWDDPVTWDMIDETSLQARHAAHCVQRAQVCGVQHSWTFTGIEHSYRLGEVTYFLTVPEGARLRLLQAERALQTEALRKLERLARESYGQVYGVIDLSSESAKSRELEDLATQLRKLGPYVPLAGDLLGGLDDLSDLRAIAHRGDEITAALRRFRREAQEILALPDRVDLRTDFVGKDRPVYIAQSDRVVLDRTERFSPFWLPCAAFNATAGIAPHPVRLDPATREAVAWELEWPKAQRSYPALPGPDPLCQPTTAEAPPVPAPSTEIGLQTAQFELALEAAERALRDCDPRAYAKFRKDMAEWAEALAQQVALFTDTLIDLPAEQVGSADDLWVKASLAAAEAARARAQAYLDALPAFAADCAFGALRIDRDVSFRLVTDAPALARVTTGQLSLQIVMVEQAADLWQGHGRYRLTSRSRDSHDPGLRVAPGHLSLTGRGSFAVYQHFDPDRPPGSPGFRLVPQVAPMFAASGTAEQDGRTRPAETPVLVPEAWVTFRIDPDALPADRVTLIIDAPDTRPGPHLLDVDKAQVEIATRVTSLSPIEARLWLNRVQAD